MPIAALVLAAGASTRMGRPKALLPLAGRTFLGHILATLRFVEVRPAIVVAAATDREVAAEAARHAASVVLNPEPQRGMLSSILCGLDRLEGTRASAVLVWPVDHPAVAASTIRALATAFERTHAPVVVPIYAGLPGHPTLFAREAFPDLRAAPVAAGARGVVEARASEAAYVEVPDEGVLLDIDRPEDFDRLAAFVAREEQAEREIR